MKIFSLLILVFAQNAWCNVEMSVGPTTNGQFKFKISEDSPRTLILTRGDKDQTLKFSDVISNAEKISITLPNNKKESRTIELLLVNISVGNTEQSVQVFVPNRPADFIMSKQTLPVCTFRNIGNFFWETPAELQKLVHVEEKNGKVTFSVDIQHELGSASKVEDCVSFRLNANSGQK